MNTMTEKIPQHSHCQICGKAIAAEDTMCSDECKQRYNGMIKRRKYLSYILYGSMIVIVVLLLMSSYLGK
ncbi:MAG TPA: DUF2116 family Zn-ribbon domain-containing protein [Candidatus Thermoplasmatota archaeon]|nr:DUF2116 family Zn-ribbon domain-containing protein [Candidatus Thermoplasmatota archaeon]